MSRVERFSNVQRRSCGNIELGNLSRVGSGSEQDQECRDRHASVSGRAGFDCFTTDRAQTRPRRCRCGPLSDVLSFCFPARDPTPSVCLPGRLICPSDFDQINFVESWYVSQFTERSRVFCFPTVPPRRTATRDVSPSWIGPRGGFPRACGCRTPVN